jgi:hypothetical protein
MTYKVENCPQCGGTHFGSYKCPFTKEQMEAMQCRGTNGSSSPSSSESSSDLSTGNGPGADK